LLQPAERSLNVSHLAVYEAEFECPKGHRFMAQANPFDSAAVTEPMCPVCYREWLAATFPRGKQITPPQRVNNVAPAAFLKGA
jgi:hypothetical protein